MSVCSSIERVETPTPALEAISARIERNVQALDARGAPRPLEGLMLNLSSPDDRPGTPADQLVVLGRFALGDGDVSLRIDLFGTEPTAGRLDVTATRGARSSLLRFEPDTTLHPLLPSPSATTPSWSAEPAPRRSARAPRIASKR